MPSRRQRQLPVRKPSRGPDPRPKLPLQRADLSASARRRVRRSGRCWTACWHSAIGSSSPAIGREPSRSTTRCARRVVWSMAFRQGRRDEVPRPAVAAVAAGVDPLGAAAAPAGADCACPGDRRWSGSRGAAGDAACPLRPLASLCAPAAALPHHRRARAAANRRAGDESPQRRGRSGHCAGLFHQHAGRGSFGRRAEEETGSLSPRRCWATSSGAGGETGSAWSPLPPAPTRPFR